MPYNRAAEIFRRLRGHSQPPQEGGEPGALSKPEEPKTVQAEKRFVVRGEGLPERCEICHQSDLFNPETGECRRCSNLPDTVFEPPLEQTQAVPAPPSLEVESNESQSRSARNALTGLFIAVALASMVYRAFVWGHLEQTSALFIGIPTILAIILAQTRNPKSATGMILKGLTVALLMSGILLGEGFICILMASPIFYLVGLCIGVFVDLSKRNNSNIKRHQALVLVPFLLMSLEGVTPRLSFPRAESVTSERMVEAGPEAVERSLSQVPVFTKMLPFYLALGFPSPVKSSGTGLEIGNRRVIHFAGGEGHPGDLTLEVVAHNPGMVKFRVVEDKSKIAHWLDWEESEVHWTALDARHTRVQWTLRYQRRLDPAWYFGPWERYAVGLTAGYLIDNLAAPSPAD